MRLREFAPSPERDENDDVPDQLLVLANRWWNATDRQPQIEHVLNSLGWSIHQVESEDDAVQLQHRDGTTHFISADDFDPDLFESQELPTKDMIAYLRQHHDTNLHQDYLDHINTFGKFVLKNIPVDTIKTELSGLDRAKVEQYKKMDFNKAPPIVVGDGYILDGYHRATAAKELGIPTIRAYVGVKGVNEISDDLRRNYLDRAGKVVDRRMDHMARVRDRLNKGYEIYHADRPTAIVDRFDADTPALARQYYEKFITRYESDVDFDLRLRRSTGIMEIARIPQSELGGWGDKDTLEPMTKPPKNRKPLPGGSQFTYAVNKKDPEFMEIMIFDGDTLAAELDLFATLDPLKTWGVETVVTDPDYRGRGLGKALYGIALSILKLTVEAGETQTKFGQAMWVMLNSIPGVEVLGYAMDRTAEYRAKPGDNVVDQNDTWTRYTFPVEPGKRSMRSQRPGTGIYSSQHVSMIARWTGQ
jgi:GNAT superfamily N-acetyltransferase